MATAIVPKGNPLVALGGELFEEFFQSILDTVELDATQKGAVGEYLKQGAIEKHDRLGSFIRRMESEAAAIKAEEARLAARRRGFEKVADMMESCIKEQMDEWQIRKVSGKLFTFAVQKNPPSVEIVDEAAIPAEFINYPPTVNRQAIKEALTEGKEVPGAKLNTEKTHLVIK